MEEYLLLLVSTILVNNVILTKFFGLCPFMGASNKLDAGIGIGLATTFVITLSSGLCWLLEHYVLTPYDIGFLRIITYILVVASAVQFTEMFIRKMSPVLFHILGIYIPLITSNCVVLGIPLLILQEQLSFIQALVYGFGSAVGFTLVMVVFSGLRERLALANVPAAFAGPPIGFITGGLLALAFMGFTGLSFK